jgi:hypothetical protein
VETKEILELLSNARASFQVALTELDNSDAKKNREIKELKKINEDIYKQNVELVKKYGK